MFGAKSRPHMTASPRSKNCYLELENIQDKYNIELVCGRLFGNANCLAIIQFCLAVQLPSQGKAIGFQTRGRRCPRDYPSHADRE